MFQYNYHKYQELFHKSNSRVRCSFCGRRGGKSISGQFEDFYWIDRGKSKCCDVLTNYDENGYYCPKCNKRLKEKDIQKVVGLLVAPTYNDISDVSVPIFKELLGPDVFEKAWKEQKKTLELPHGILYCRSADNPEKIGRGGKYHFIHIDEARDCKRLGSLVSTLWPTLADYQGNMWVTTTTNGKDEAWKEFYNKAYNIWRAENPLALTPQEPVYDTNPDGDSDYTLFTWRTVDNTALPHLQKEVQDAKSRMPEWKWRQEYFATVEQFRGLVYPMFNEDTHVVPERMFDRDDILYVGIDVGWNHPTAVTFMIRSYEGNYYIVDELYKRQKTVPEMAVMIKDKLNGLARFCKQGIPFEPHIFIIDPASKQKRQDSDGTSIFEQYQIEGIPVVAGNNDVRAGIDKVTQYLSDEVDGKKKLLVFETCEHHIDEYGSYRWKDNQNGELTEEVYKVKDDLCLVGNAKVMTEHGEKKIKDIINGDRVYTRDGLRVVENSRMTRRNQKVVRVYTTEGYFDCTPDHKIITDSGKVGVDTIRYGIIYTWKQNTKERHTSGTGTITRDLLRIKRQFICYTELFGKIIMEIFHRVWLSIILTTIQLIMKSAICRCLREENIRVFTAKRDGIMQRLKCSNILTILEALQKNGTGVKKEGNGTRSTERGAGKQGGMLKRNVNIVERDSEQSHTIKGSARVSASRHTGESRVLMMLLWYVSYVVKSFLKTNILKQEPAHVLAVVNLPVRQNVYNLTVNKIHEYYANGILVANCDADRYLIMSHPEDMEKPKRDRWGVKVDPDDPYGEAEDITNDSSPDWMDSDI